MKSYNNIIRPVLFSLALVSSPLFALDCGEVPAEPEVIDGANATMDELVANSQSVKAFIAGADTFLDCGESYVKSDEFKALGADEQKEILDRNARILAERNGIGEKFNAQVAAYKAANPQ